MANSAPVPDQVRLDHAKKMLKGPSVSHVCYALGFEITSFTALFKKSSALTPPFQQEQFLLEKDQHQNHYTTFPFCFQIWMVAKKQF
jgi:hypothetical protein